MNEIKVLINFKKRTNVITGVDLTSGDYNSTKIIFEFDRNDGTKIFELKNPKNEVVFSKEIINNEVILANIDENGMFSSIFNMAGEYIFEVSLYTNDGKLTSDYNYLNVEKEQVVISDEVVEPYLPVFDELIKKTNTAITETNNLDIDIENSVITITKKDGTKKSENVKGESGIQGIQGIQGEKGDKGDTGPQGEKGEKGDKGDKGEKGEKGDSVRPQNSNINPTTLLVNTIYDLGIQTELNLNLPAGILGDFIEVDFLCDVATNLTITSTSGLSELDLIPEAGMIYSLFFDWGRIDETTYGWRISYAEYVRAEV